MAKREWPDVTDDDVDQLLGRWATGFVAIVAVAALGLWAAAFDFIMAGVVAVGWFAVSYRRRAKKV